VVIAAAFGITLFLLDLKFGTLSFIFGGFPSVITIAIITAIVAGDIGDGFLSCLFYEVLGVTIVVFAHPFLYPEWEIATSDLLTTFIVVMMLAVENSFDSSPWPWILAPILIALLFIIAPLVFLAGLIASLIGGLIGRFLHARILGRDYSRPAPQRPPVEEGVLE
jgi:hypothetical protein